MSLLAEKIQAETRRGVKQEEIQPGSEFFFNSICLKKIGKCDFLFLAWILIDFLIADMKVWSDPFERKQ